MASLSEQMMANTFLAQYHLTSNYAVIDGVKYFPGTTRDFLKHVENLPVRGDEVIVAAYPKSGTTWMSEIVWQILLDGRLDMTPIYQRVPFVDDLKKLCNIDSHEEHVETFLNKPYPRVFQTHLSYPYVPKGDGVTKPKYVNVIRNPKDCAVSFYHNSKRFLWHNFDGTWEEFFEMFINGEVEHGSWFNHVLGWWEHRDDPNILILKYEDIKKDSSTAVKQVAKLVGKHLSEETVQLIIKQTSFEAMSNSEGRYYDGNEFTSVTKPNTSKFIRKGEVGDWKNYFTEDQNQRFDELYDKRMAGSGLEFEFY